MAKFVDSFILSTKMRQIIVRFGWIEWVKKLDCRAYMVHVIEILLKGEIVLESSFTRDPIF